MNEIRAIIIKMFATGIFGFIAIRKIKVILQDHIRGL